MPGKTSPQAIAFIGFTILVFSMGVGRFAYTPLLPAMRAEGLLEIAQSGWLASVHFVGYAMGALLGIRLITAARRTLVVALVVISLSTLVMGLSNELTVWLVARWSAGHAGAPA